MCAKFAAPVFAVVEKRWCRVCPVDLDFHSVFDSFVCAQWPGVGRVFIDMGSPGTPLA